ncbi:MAG: FtsX-like permease family protein [Usitatibacter sp.]
MRERASSAIDMARLAALFAIVGRRVAFAFGAVTFVLVFLIAALQVSSRHALKSYVEDQLARVPWDLSVYQANDFESAPAMREAIGKVAGIAATADLYFLRTMMPAATVGYVDGEALRTPWMSLLAATKPDLLPPEVRPRSGGAVLVLVGSQSQMGDAFTRLQGRREFELRSERSHRSVRVFSVPIERVVRLERAEINRWFMEQTSSPTLVPELGLILAVDDDARLEAAFDEVSRGLASNHGHEHARDPNAKLGPADDLHGDAGQYFPDIIHLARIERGALVDGWDPEASRERIEALGEAVRTAAQAVSFRVGMDNNTRVLLERMARTARQVGLISLLAALPLAWMAWVLLANIATLLLLNARRTWGLLRLRGTPARLIASAVVGGVALGALGGALAGCALGTVGPLAWYGDGTLSPARAWRIVDARFIALAAALGVGIALRVSLRLVRFALTVSPLEAAARVAPSEGAHAGVRFGMTGFVVLAIGVAKVAQWVAAGAGIPVEGPAWWRPVDRVLDFAAYPFLVYGITALVASRVHWLAAVLRPLAHLFGRGMAELSLRHFAARPHRAAAVVLVVSLAASLCLYPSVLTAVFDDKIRRAAHVQLANPLQVTLNTPDLLDATALARGRLAERYPALRTALQALRSRLEALPEVQSAGFLAEGLVDGLYLEGQGFNSTPIYLVDRADEYLARFHHEEALTADGHFSRDLTRLAQGGVLASAALSDYFPHGVGDTMSVGRNADGRMAAAQVAGIVRLLPGAPGAAVATRDSFSTARVDYLNHLFERRAYLVAAADSARIADLDMLIPRVVFSIAPRAGIDPLRLREAVLAALPARALEVRELEDEVLRLGSDMYVFLARQNVRIYLLGGLLMALIGIVAVALANFADDRRTLALLRVRGARRRDVLAFLSAGLTAPALAGILLGAPIALVVGYGITHVIWQLRELKTIVTYLPAHLAISSQTAALALLLCAAVLAIVLGMGRWVFARTARGALAEH